MSPEEINQLEERLAAPFDPNEVKFRPASVHGNRALALAYVDARVIQDRLDSVVGVTGWQDEFESLADGSVMCKLRLRINGEWITKMDVGSQSEQPDEGDRRKAAFSDALKRTAVKFGVGRYLYRLPQLWCDYDPQKKQFARRPSLPDWALPAAANGKPASAPPPAKPAAPTTWAALMERIGKWEKKLREEEFVTARGDELTRKIDDEARLHDWPADPQRWTAEQIALASSWLDDFIRGSRQAVAQTVGPQGVEHLKQLMKERRRSAADIFRGLKCTKTDLKSLTIQEYRRAVALLHQETPPANAAANGKH